MSAQNNYLETILKSEEKYKKNIDKSVKGNYNLFAYDHIQDYFTQPKFCTSLILMFTLYRKKKSNSRE